MPKSNDPRGQDSVRSHPRILFARAIIKTGYVHKDIRLIRNGQNLLLKTIRALDNEVSPTVQLELPLGDQPK
jgi:hypothetical protein